ncbi:MAG: RluA family pseudouridine synthase, partial [Candidatus Eisenbacteria bacterium]|nr:RluA family pseudouridine synthase [Candidatus Eisenbacteria bacterium]
AGGGGGGGGGGAAAPPAPPPRPFPPGIVHRLDRDTSGLLLLSLTPEAHRLLTQAFRDRSIRKRYLALVAGRIRPRQGTIDRPLARVPSGRMRVTASGSGMRAVTRYRTLASTAEASLLEVEPQTGRTHQIRVHLASIGHPVAGDPLYGEARTALGAPRLWLHASRIELPPALALALEAPAAIDCPLWEDLRAHLASLGIRSPLADGTGSSPPDGPAGGSPGQDARNT